MRSLRYSFFVFSGKYIVHSQTWIHDHYSQKSALNQLIVHHFDQDIYSFNLSSNSRLTKKNLQPAIIISKPAGHDMENIGSTLIYDYISRFTSNLNRPLLLPVQSRESISHFFPSYVDTAVFCIELIAIILYIIRQLKVYVTVLRLYAALLDRKSVV